MTYSFIGSFRWNSEIQDLPYLRVFCKSMQDEVRFNTIEMEH